jgi:hypothetical protein
MCLVLLSWFFCRDAGLQKRSIQKISEGWWVVDDVSIAASNSLKKGNARWICVYGIILETSMKKTRKANYIVIA